VIRELGTGIPDLRGNGVCFEVADQSAEEGDGAIGKSKGIVIVWMRSHFVLTRLLLWLEGEGRMMDVGYLPHFPLVADSPRGDRLF
jgi:hypothetical protein